MVSERIGICSINIGILTRRIGLDVESIVMLSRIHVIPKSPNL